MIIINGKTISEITSKKEKIDETKTESAYYIKEIHINSCLATVKVSACDTNDISAHLHGDVSSKQDIVLRIIKDLDKITISVDTKGSSNETTQISIGSCNIFVGSSNSVSINNINIDSLATSDLVLDVKIPLRLFKKLFINNNNGNVLVNPYINIEELNIECKNGNVDVKILPRLLNIFNKNGNISVTATAKNDCELDVSSKNGNIRVDLLNIGTSTVEVISKNGNYSKKPKTASKGIHNISGNISNKNGNITFEY